MSSNTTNTEQQSSPLLALPSEIRAPIYEHLFENSYFRIWDTSDPPYIGLGYQYERNILYTCKQLLVEALPILQKAMRVELSVHPRCRKEFRQPVLHGMLPPSVMKTVTWVECSLFASLKPIINGLFPGLRVLHLRNCEATLDSGPNPNTFELVMPITGTSPSEIELLATGGFDKEVATTMGKGPLRSTYARALRGIPRLSTRTYKVLVTAQVFSCFGSWAIEKWDLRGKTVYEREVTFDWDTREVLCAKNLFSLECPVVVHEAETL